MKSNRAEYEVQPAYNESVLPTCPPSYSEAVASSSRGTPGVYQLPDPKQPGIPPQQPQIPAAYEQPQAVTTYQHPQVPGAFPPSQPSVLCSTMVLPPTQAPNVTLPVAVGPKSANVRCPYCYAHIRTRTTTQVKRSAHYCCCLLFFCGCLLCSCIPYCLSSFKNVNHTCPACNSFIGTYRP